MCDTLEKIEIIHTTVINADIFGSWTVRSREPILPWQASNNSLPLRSWRCCIVGSILISIERPCLLLRISPRGTRWYTRDHVDKCCISLQMASLACQNISACPPFVYSTLESTRVGYQQAWNDDALHRLTRKWSDNTT